MSDPHSNELRVGATFEARGASIDEVGRGVIEVGERRLHVPGLWPGERARIRVDAIARFSPAAHGHLLELLETHPRRRAPVCPRHRDPLRPTAHATCGGCPLMQLEVDVQRDLVRARLRDELGLELDQVIGGAEWGYRWSCKRVVGGRVGDLRLGSRRADALAHPGQIADMAGCRVDHPAIEAAFSGLLELAKRERILAWREGSGDLRYVWAKTNGEQVLLTLVTGSATSEAARRLPGPAMASIANLAGIAWSVQPESGNAMRGDTPEILAGASTLELELAGVHVEVGPLGFLQPNPKIAALAYLDLVEAPAGGRVWDLYAGIGVTTALLRQRHDVVVPCESYAESATVLGVPPRSVEAFLASESGRPDLIVANPPRGGLGARVCEQLLARDAPRLHLMSCNATSLAADLARLAPTYELERLRGYDTLPQTAHLELVAHLRRT